MESLSVRELRQRCEQAGVNVLGLTEKSEMIKALLAAEAAASKQSEGAGKNGRDGIPSVELLCGHALVQINMLKEAAKEQEKMHTTQMTELRKEMQQLIRTQTEVLAQQSAATTRLLQSLQTQMTSLQAVLAPRAAGLTCAQAKAAGLACIQARAAGFSCKDAREAGFSCKDAREAGMLLTCKDAKEAGFTCKDVREAGFTCKEAREAGMLLTCKDAREAGFTCKDVREAGFTCKEAREAGFTCKDVREAGFSMAEVKRAGYSVREAQEAGYPAGYGGSLFVSSIAWDVA
jgi:ribosomal protein L13E